MTKIKILIPTAKELNEKNEVAVEKIADKVKNVIDVLVAKSVEDIKKDFKISLVRAEVEKMRFLQIKNETSKNYVALNLFDGLMYRNINRNNLSTEEESYFLKNVFITSALYGIINSTQAIAPHRLDFHSKVTIKNMSLKKYWQNDYDSFIKSDDLVISLLSSEFLEVFSKDVRDKFIKIVFAKNDNGNLKIHSTTSKKCRGKLVSILAKNNITTLEELKKVSVDNFKFREELSTEKELFFIGE